MTSHQLNRNQLFDQLCDIWNRERENRSQIVGLSSGFYTDIRLYIDQFLKRIDEETDSITKKILERRLDRLNYIKNDIIDIRTRKIFNYVLKNKDIDVNLAQEEYTFYSNLKKVYKLFIKGILDPKKVAFMDDLDFLETKEGSHENDEKIDYVTLRIVDHIKDEFVGSDGIIYGPFNPEEICLIPRENAIGLVKGGMAEKIELD